MKLLLDQNLSYRLCRPLSRHFEKVDQVRRLGMQDAPDDDIWNFARRDGYTIITRDADFVSLLEQRGAPPKVVYLPLGRAPTGYIETCLLSAVDRIREMGASADVHVLILSAP